MIIAQVLVIRTSTDDKTETQKDFSPSPQSLAIAGKSKGKRSDRSHLIGQLFTLS
ncbi:hypothetical protein [Nostoc sp. ChiQUE01b]|uniref:hypothetical protein n=1 Tax=Nostoc sp. ChiQUE01b TaxID=3075376 RepID=UPI002AD55C46|nr:hypothetical protein [Nostoc sp. ChiQUE01b]MDZ8263059.1 hypothetical protein [Nostoc sp. ChiQUE01b]